ncbi:hypothetical protein HMI54_010327 [Coelomomyces lativittatus]|nr:hypothetical protein HMI56_002235 [Coelomomyces lativittatus]KAJ1509856.1 hypothetical protein HMI55_007232 [Coelomomyces lativittatus]KAJ1516224.1 hypothetical protein HMI54_010327 [Coelomomyces lativittatus]
MAFPLQLDFSGDTNQLVQPLDLAQSNHTFIIEPFFFIIYCLEGNATQAEVESFVLFLIRGIGSEDSKKKDAKTMILSSFNAFFPGVIDHPHNPHARMVTKNVPIAFYRAYLVGDDYPGYEFTVDFHRICLVSDAAMTKNLALCVWTITTFPRGKHPTKSNYQTFSKNRIRAFYGRLNQEVPRAEVIAVFLPDLQGLSCVHREFSL